MISHDLNISYYFSIFTDAITDTSIAARWTRELCERSNLIPFFRHISRHQSPSNSESSSRASSAAATTTKLLAAKLKLLWFNLHTTSQLFRRDAIEGALTDVSSHAAALREVSLSYTRRNVQQHGQSDVGIGEQSLRSSVDATLWRWNFKSNHFGHRSRASKFTIGITGGVRRS